MSQDPLKIVAVDHNKKAPPRPSSTPKTNREQAQAYFERMWQHDPRQFDPARNCMERERVHRIINSLPPITDKKVLDLGCGNGVLSRLLRDLGANVTAVDIAKNALKSFEQEDAKNMTLVHDFIPHTKLEEEDFDLVLSADLIGHLNPRDHRLLFSEMARLVKRDGFVICSTPIDIYSEDALEKFASLAETEFDVHSWTLSYHRLYIITKNLLKAPETFAKAWKEINFREKESAKREGISRWWFRVNSSPLIGRFWSVIQSLSKPLYQFFNQSQRTLLAFEKVCRILLSDRGISHAIFVAKLRPLVETEHPLPEPVQRKGKKRVWE